ncbi:MAG TPA: hypothetical protein VMB34_10355 [Acetobacteraceae bacterium]|nr:hypothetical protein [Acetobacteraceae bacterium]
MSFRAKNVGCHGEGPMPLNGLPPGGFPRLIFDMVLRADGL